MKGRCFGLSEIKDGSGNLPYLMVRSVPRNLRPKRNKELVNTHRNLKRSFKDSYRKYKKEKKEMMKAQAAIPEDNESDSS